MMTSEDQDVTKKLIEDFERNLGKFCSANQSILDIGCGTGEFLFRSRNILGNGKFHGIDQQEYKNLSMSDFIRYDYKGAIDKEIGNLVQNKTCSNFFKILNRTYLNIDDIKTDEQFKESFNFLFNTFFASNLFEENSFDLIIINRVLHQISCIAELEKFLTNALSILKPTGYIFISQHNNLKELERTFSIIKNHSSQIEDEKYKFNHSSLLNTWHRKSIK